MRLDRLVEKQAHEHPQACAVRDVDGTDLTYAELWNRAGSVAAALMRRGISTGSIVVIALDRSIALVEAALGVVRSGAAYVFLDPVSPPARNALIVEQTDAAAIIETAQPAPWRPPTTAELIVLPLPPIDVVPDTVPESDDDGDLMYVAYTSGSSGRPKGVLATHRAVAQFVTDTALVELTPTDTVASLASPASDATTFELWKPLVAGATIVVLPSVTDIAAGEWGPLLQQQGVTVMFAMAGLVDLLSRYEPTAFASLRTVVFGGEALDPRSAARVLRDGPPKRLVLGYGPTETTVFATCFDCTLDSIGDRDRIPLGQALDGYTLRVLNEALAPVPSGAAGELCIGGPAVADGYLAMPDVTAERFVTLPGGERVYRSGDRVHVAPDGALLFVARDDRQVKIRGYRIELDEVERAVSRSGLVSVVAVERSVTAGTTTLVCFFVPSAELPADPAEQAIVLAGATAALVPGYMIPALWVPLSSMPRNGIGKIDRGLLRERIQTEPGRRIGEVER